MVDEVKLRQQLCKFPKRKVCERGKVYGFWIKEFTNVHKKIIKHLNKYLENGKTPEWMTKRGTFCLCNLQE